MKPLNLKITLLSVLCFFAVIATSTAQNGSLTINQDERINELLNLKKEIDKNDSERYKIQIYSGNSRSSAYKAQDDFTAKYSNVKTKVVYEEPNFKTWVGNYRTKIEADRAIRQIKKDFSNALIFKPKN